MSAGDKYVIAPNAINNTDDDLELGAHDSPRLPSSHIFAVPLTQTHHSPAASSIHSLPADLTTRSTGDSTIRSRRPSITGSNAFQTDDQVEALSIGDDLNFNHGQKSHKVEIPSKNPLLKPTVAFDSKASKLSISTLSPGASKKTKKIVKLATRLQDVMQDIEDHHNEALEFHHNMVAKSGHHQRYSSLSVAPFAHENEHPNNTNKVTPINSGSMDQIKISHSRRQSLAAANHDLDPNLIKDIPSVTNWKPYDNHKNIASPTPKNGTKGFQELARGASTNRKPRRLYCITSKFARKANKVISNRYYSYISILLTLYSLYAYDFCQAFFPKSADFGIDISLLILLIFFSAEIMLNIIVKPNYIFSFFFFMDVVGTFTLVFDINFIWERMSGHTNRYYSSSHSSEGFSFEKNVNVVKLARFIRVLRLLRFVRLLKVFRSSRITLLFRHPNKIGFYLSELMDKRVILLILYLVIIVPLLFLESTPITHSEMYGCEIINMVSDTNPSQLPEMIEVFQDAQTNLFFLQIGTTFYIDETSESKYSDLRSFEMEFYYVNDLTAIFSQRDALYYSSIFSIALTTTILIVFCVTSQSIENCIYHVVVAPLERMTGIIRKLTGTISFLTNNAAMNPEQDRPKPEERKLIRTKNVRKQEKGSLAHGKLGEVKDAAEEEPEEKEEPVDGLGENESEMQFVENTMQKLISLFAIESNTNSHYAKPYQLMFGQKNTKIIMENSIVSIEITERPVWSDKEITEEKVDTLLKEARDPHRESGTEVSKASMVGGSDSKGESDDEGAVNKRHKAAAANSLNPAQAQYLEKEFPSVETILFTPSVLPYFHLYLQSIFVAENLQFVLEVDRFHDIIKLHCLQLFQNFIATKAANQINLSAENREQIFAQLSSPQASIFDSAQLECKQLLAQHYHLFLASHFVQAYLRKKVRKDRQREILAQITKKNQTTEKPNVPSNI